MITNYRDLLYAHRKFVEVYDSYDYDNVVKAIKSAVNSEQKAFAVLCFLIGWNWQWFTKCKKYCMLSQQDVRVDLLITLHKKLVDIINELEKEELFKEHLDKVELNELKDRIIYFYDKISKDFGHTGASKILHVLYPNFFVMWDSGIRENYGFGSSGYEYVRFLSKMQEMIKLVLLEYAKDMGVSIDIAREMFIKDCDGYPPTKVIDEYNFINKDKFIISEGRSVRGIKERCVVFCLCPNGKVVVFTTNDFSALVRLRRGHANVKDSLNFDRAIEAVYKSIFGHPSSQCPDSNFKRFDPAYGIGESLKKIAVRILVGNENDLSGVILYKWVDLYNF